MGGGWKTRNAKTRSECMSKKKLLRPSYNKFRPFQHLEQANSNQKTRRERVENSSKETVGGQLPALQRQVLTMMGARCRNWGRGTERGREMSQTRMSFQLRQNHDSIVEAEHDRSQGNGGADRGREGSGTAEN